MRPLQLRGCDRMTTANIAFLCMQKTPAGCTPYSTSAENPKIFLGCGILIMAYEFSLPYFFFSTKYSIHKLALGFSVVLLLIYLVLKIYSSTRWRGCLRNCNCYLLSAWSDVLQGMAKPTGLVDVIGRQNLPLRCIIFETKHYLRDLRSWSLGHQLSKRLIKLSRI